MIGCRDLRDGRRFEGQMALLALLATLIGGWSMTRVRGDILNHELLRFTAFGVLNLAVIAAAGLGVIMNRDTGTAERWLAARRAAVGGAAVVFVALGIRDLTSLTSFERRRTERTHIVQAYTAIRDHLRAQGLRHPLLQIDEEQWPVAAGILLRLRHDGVVCAVEEDKRWMFTKATAATGEEDTVISLANGPRHREWRARPGTFVLYQSSRVNVDARREPPTAR
jgi:hypothetical protein